MKGINKPGESFSLKGTYNYFVEPLAKGTPPFQSTIISLTAYSKSDRKIAIATKCKWYRIRGERKTQLLGINSNTFQISAQDIGAIIEIDVIPQEDEYKGTAIITFGPILLDPQIKCTLEGLLSAGGSKFPISLICEEKEIILKNDWSLMITSDYIRLVTNLGLDEKSVKFKYGLERPEIEMNYLDTKRMAFNFKENEEWENISNFLMSQYIKHIGKRVQFEFVSKNSRDLVFLAMKIFSAKNYLIDSKIINSLDEIFNEGGLFNLKNGINLGQFLLEIDSMKKELTFIIRQNQQITNEKESLNKEILSLEKELSETIQAYTEALNDLRQNPQNLNMTLNESVLIQELSTLGGRKIDEVSYRYELKKLQQEKQSLLTRINQMSEELELNRHFNKNEGYFSESKIWVKNNEIQNDIIELKQSHVLNRTTSENFMDNRAKELEKTIFNQGKIIDELRFRNENLEKKTQKFNENNFVKLESKYNESKRLNEHLLNELKNLKNIYESLKNENINRNMSDSIVEIKNNEILNLNKEYEILKIRLAQTEAELYSKNTNKMSGNEINLEISTLKSKNNRLELDVNDLNKKIEFLENENRNLKKNNLWEKKYEEIKRENDRLEKQVSFLNQEISEKQKSERQRKIIIPSSNISEIQQLLIEKSTANERLIQENSVLLKENLSLKSELVFIQKMATSLQQKPSEKLEDSFMLNRTIVFEMEGENQSLKAKLSGLESILKDYQLKYNELLKSYQKNVDSNSKVIENEDKIKNLLNENQILKSQNQRLYQEIDSYKNEIFLLNSELELSKKNPIQQKIEKSFRESNNSLLNRTFQVELEGENESLRKNITSLEEMLKDYKTQMALLFKENTELKNNNSNSKNNKTNNENNDIIENLMKINKKLSEENGRLTILLQNKADISMFKGEDEKENNYLREKIKELENEIELISNEKDKLIVELSRYMANS